MDDKNKDIEALMVRFLQGTCTADEKSQFLSWLNGDDENEASFFQMKEIYDTRKRISVSGRQEIRTATVQRPERNRPARRPRSLYHTAWMRYAAIFALVFGTLLVVHFWQQLTPTAPVVYVKQMVIHNTRGVYAVSLPDGSKVWLHGGTTLTYPEQFTDSLRTVGLQGEAYFAVQSDEAHPFVVQTPTAKVRATGTEFNITAYPGDRMTTTTLVKGVVDVQPNHLATSVQLKPGQQAVAGANDTQVRVTNVTANAAKTPAKKEETPVVVQSINVDLYTDWKDGVYRFKNEPFQNIALRLEKMYGVEIRIESAALKTSSFSGMFTTDYSLKEIFEIINISNPITYKVEDKTVYIRNKR